MLYFNNFIDNLIILYTYMFIYNISLFLFFWLIHQFINIKFINLFSFNDFKFNFFFLILITFVFFSISGIPPFIGFFSKILILITLINSNLFLIYLIFFILLFFSLYFYLQNIRFLYSISKGQLNYAYFFNNRFSISFFFNSFFFLFFLIFGIFFFEDLIIYFNWLIIN